MSSSRTRAVGYIRVSLESENPENQRIAIIEYCKNSNIELVNIFEDIGVSGAKPALERHGFKSMLEYCKSNNIKTIIMFDLTRLGRDLFDTVITMKYLLENSYNVIFIKNPEVSFTGKEGVIEQAIRKAILALLSAFAEIERAYISERTKQGIERAKKQGKHVGRPSIMHDPKKQELFKIIVCKEKLPYRKASEMLGLTESQIKYWAKKLC